MVRISGLGAAEHKVRWATHEGLFPFMSTLNHGTSQQQRRANPALEQLGRMRVVDLLARYSLVCPRR